MSLVGLIKSVFPGFFRQPKIGEVWTLVTDQDPWGREAGRATVLDTKDGWVRYSLGKVFNDERMPVSTFIAIFTPPQEKQP